MYFKLWYQYANEKIYVKNIYKIREKRKESEVYIRSLTLYIF